MMKILLNQHGIGAIYEILMETRRKFLYNVEFSFNITFQNKEAPIAT